MVQGKREHVLVVEDEAALGRLLKRLLETVGYSVHLETHGVQALTYIAEHRVDLVILDLGLPGMGGYEVCSKLRQSEQPWNIPVIMLTGWDKPIDQLRGYAHGADAYLTKPCEPAEILRTVALLLGETAVP